MDHKNPNYIIVYWSHDGIVLHYAFPFYLIEVKIQLILFLMADLICMLLHGKWHVVLTHTTISLLCQNLKSLCPHTTISTIIPTSYIILKRKLV